MSYSVASCRNYTLVRSVSLVIEVAPFTDVYAECPDGKARVVKLTSISRRHQGQGGHVRNIVQEVSC